MTPAAAATWLNGSLLAAFFASVLFVLGATFIFPWWKSRLGESLVIMDALWALTMLPLVLGFFGLISDRGILFTQYYAATLSLTAATALWRLWVIYREQRGERQRGKSGGKDG